GLGITGQPAVLEDVLGNEGVADLLGKPPVVVGVDVLAQNPCALGQVPGRPGEVGGRHQVLVGPAGGRVVGRGGRIQPVAQLETLVPEPVGTGQSGGR